MFYCHLCAEENNWPNSVFKSYGPCEICGRVMACSDVPSKDLPIPGMTMEETRKSDDKMREALKHLGY